MLSLYINDLPHCQRLAWARDGRLVRFQTLFEDTSPAPGSIYMARITKVTSGIAAAFVDLGTEQGFLNVKGERPLVFDSGKPVRVAEPKEGQAVLVQLQKPALRDKLATLGAEIKLVGFHGILFPMGSGLRFSRDFRGDKDLVRSVFEGLSPENEQPGWLIRSIAAEVDPAVLAMEGRVLLAQWQKILEDTRSGKTRLVHQDHHLLRFIRDGYKEGFQSIHCDTQASFEELRDILRNQNPTLLPVLKMHDVASPLFDTYRIEDEVAHLNDSRLWLKSGGSIDINQTEAMVTVDVNTSKNARDGKGTSAALRTNLEAAAEIGRQITARNLAGLIVLDFVNARESGWRNKVEDTLKKALQQDDVKWELVPINKLGVAMISRQRGDRDHNHSLNEPCNRCGGKGWVKRTQALAIDIQRKLLRQVHGLEGETLVVKAGGELAAYLLENRDLLFEAIERNHGVTIRVEKAGIAPRAYQIEM